jgi:glucosamine 6-phosphate synthetase-like amidotransferase/phosphosugar isomerase protein
MPLVNARASLSDLTRRRPFLFSAVIEIVPLQLLAYYVARENGCDIDKPKNLAKSVTVE